MENKYPEYIIINVRENLGLEPDDTSKDELISEMSKEEILRRVLEWDGLIGYGYTIRKWIEDIYKVKLTE